MGGKGGSLYKDEDFAARALGFPSSRARSPGHDFELQVPLSPECAVRLRCDCGFIAELTAEAVEKLGLSVPEDGWPGKFIATTRCFFCLGRKELMNPRILPIP